MVGVSVQAQTGEATTEETTITATTTTPTPKRMQEASEARQEVRTTNQEASREALTGVRQQRITNLAANISNRMDAVVVRLSSITVRIDSRITKLKDAGIDTEMAEAELTNAKNLLNEIKTLLVGIDYDVAKVTGSENPRTAWQDLKAKYRNISEKIKATHQSLRSTIALLKSAMKSATMDRPAETTNATTTSDTEETVLLN